jgi:hypothetical protein
MRMLINVNWPLEPFNTYVKDGSIGRRMNDILSEVKPEAVYFTEKNGGRAAILIVDLEKPSKVPALAEPWFLAFNAEVQFHVVMSPEDLQEAGLDRLGEKWA